MMMMMMMMMMTMVVVVTQVNAVKEFQPKDKLLRARMAVASAGTLIGFAFFWIYISFLIAMIRHVRS